MLHCRVEFWTMEQCGNYYVINSHNQSIECEVWCTLKLNVKVYPYTWSDVMLWKTKFTLAKCYQLIISFEVSFSEMYFQLRPSSKILIFW